MPFPPEITVLREKIDRNRQEKKSLLVFSWGVSFRVSSNLTYWGLRPVLYILYIFICECVCVCVCVYISCFTPKVHTTFMACYVNVCFIKMPSRSTNIQISISIFHGGELQHTQVSGLYLSSKAKVSIQLTFSNAHWVSNILPWARWCLDKEKRI